jgi:hypothetical protein
LLLLFLFVVTRLVVFPFLVRFEFVGVCLPFVLGFVVGTPVKPTHFMPPIVWRMLYHFGVSSIVASVQAIAAELALSLLNTARGWIFFLSLKIYLSSLALEKPTLCR